MPTTLLRILKSGTPVALALAGLGYLFATVAGILADSTAGASIDPGTTTRIPLMMAAWGFGLVAAGELLFGFGRRGAAATPPAVTGPQPKAGGLDPDVERLLNDLLTQADAARAKADAGSVPPDQVDEEPVAEEVAVARHG